MRDGVIVTNSAYQVIDINPAAGKIINMPIRETIGKNIGGILPRLAFCEVNFGIPESGKTHRDYDPGHGKTPLFRCAGHADR